METTAMKSTTTVYTHGRTPKEALDSNVVFTNVHGTISMGLPEDEDIYEITVVRIAKKIRAPEGTKRYKQWRP
jgi:hypothetical protein